MAPTIARWSTRCATPDGRARGVATVTQDVTDAQLARAARGGRARRALQLRQTSRRRHAARRAARHRAPHRAARLARGRVFRGAGPAGARLSSPRCRRSWSSITWAGPTCASRSTVRIRAFVRFMREHGNVWSKVSGAERLSASGPPATDDFVPFARRIVETFPDRVLWGTDWPHPNMKIAHARRRRPRRPAAAHRADAELQRRCSSTTRCGSTGTMTMAENLSGHSRHDGVRRRAVAQGLSPQHVLHVADEGREPRALQGERARLSG